MEDNNKNAGNIASLVLGIISVISSLFWYITVPTGILAIVFGVKSVKRTGSKMAKAGIVTGIVGLAIFAFIYKFNIDNSVGEFVALNFIKRRIVLC